MKFKILVIIFIIIFGFQSWVKADDINEFEIEGMSIGDSLLKFYNNDNRIDRWYFLVNIFKSNWNFILD